MNGATNIAFISIEIPLTGSPDTFSNIREENRALVKYGAVGSVPLSLRAIFAGVLILMFGAVLRQQLSYTIKQSLTSINVSKLDKSQFSGTTFKCARPKYVCDSAIKDFR
jgi:hypothetical protein